MKRAGGWALAGAGALLVLAGAAVVFSEQPWPLVAYGGAAIAVGLAALALGVAVTRHKAGTHA